MSCVVLSKVNLSLLVRLDGNIPKTHFLIGVPGILHRVPDQESAGPFASAERDAPIFSLSTCTFAQCSIVAQMLRLRPG